VTPPGNIRTAIKKGWAHGSTTLNDDGEQVVTPPGNIRAGIKKGWGHGSTTLNDDGDQVVIPPGNIRTANLLCLEKGWAPDGNIRTGHREGHKRVSDRNNATVAADISHPWHIDGNAAWTDVQDKRLFDLVDGKAIKRLDYGPAARAVCEAMTEVRAGVNMAGCAERWRHLTKRARAIPAAAAVEKEEGPLPEGWLSRTHKGTGNICYYHAGRQISQWDRPTEDDSGPLGVDDPGCCKDNASNRQLDRVGEKKKHKAPAPIAQLVGVDDPGCYKDNARNRRLDRVGEKKKKTGRLTHLLAQLVGFAEPGASTPADACKTAKRASSSDGAGNAEAKKKRTRKGPSEKSMYEWDQLLDNAITYFAAHQDPRTGEGRWPPTFGLGCMSQVTLFATRFNAEPTVETRDLGAWVMNQRAASARSFRTPDQLARLATAGIITNLTDHERAKIDQAEPQLAPSEVVEPGKEVPL